MAPESAPGSSEGVDHLEIRQVTDPQIMRALAHPVRLALLETLSLYGPLTATQAGERIGESATTCSFHLRQLANYGFVEEAGGGKGRARPWRMSAYGMSMSTTTEDPAADIAANTLSRMARQRSFARLENWLDARLLSARVATRGDAVRAPALRDRRGARPAGRRAQRPVARALRGAPSRSRQRAPPARSRSKRSCSPSRRAAARSGAGPMTMRSTERLVQDRIAEMRRQKGPDLPQWRHARALGGGNVFESEHVAVALEAGAEIGHRQDHAGRGPR